MLTLPAELTQHQAGDCLAALTAGLRGISGNAVVLDASGLQRFDSSALAVLLACRRQALAVGKSFQVAAMTKPLRDLATLYGIVELLGAP